MTAFLYTVGRYTVLPGGRNCDRSAVSTDYTAKPGIENCYSIKNKNRPPVHCSTEHRDFFLGKWTQLGHYTVLTIRNIGFVKYGFVQGIFK